MPKVKFTTHLVRYFPTLENPTTAEGNTVAAVVDNLNKAYPGLADYIVDERGVLRKHVNIFVRGDLIHDRQTLQDPVTPEDEVFIFQALSGG